MGFGRGDSPEMEADRGLLTSRGFGKGSSRLGGIVSIVLSADSNTDAAIRLGSSTSEI